MSLQKIQAELKVPKNQYNSFCKYKYRSYENILEAVKPLLQKYDCTLTLSDEIINVADRIYVKATAKFKDAVNEITVTAYARESESKKGMDESQITGTASSYARKYALNGLFLIDDTKDADTDEYVQATTDKFMTANHIETIKKYCVEFKTNTEKICEKYKIKDLSDMTYEQFKDCTDNFEKAKK